MEKVWELYRLAQRIIQKLCKSKCINYGTSKIDACSDYVNKRLEANEFKALKNYDNTRGAKESTYLHMLVSSRIIDFFNSATHKREFANESSINNSVQDEEEQVDYSGIKEVIFSLLSDKEACYIEEFYLNSISAKELASIYGVHTDKQILKILENARKKLKTKLKKMGYELEDLL